MRDAFYTRANGAVKCKEVEDGYATITSYGKYSLTTYFPDLDSMAEYLYYTAADESDSFISIRSELESFFVKNAE
ncbi:hypothetical protein GYA27_01360 [candidate division WWE3 bacterium]|uniref:Uncharacterized protein n=1 Tax=candidate division WWE3 bacterium TaxID=2053526 RepID=A0A7X9DJW5_UNCKA|nr:hypothetical protein [candidate division WWE3 bacterium]